MARYRVTDRGESRGYPGQPAVQRHGRVTQRLNHLRVAFVAARLEHGTAPQQLGYPVCPGAERPERAQQHEPENYRKQAIVCLDAHGLFDAANPFERVVGHGIFDQRSRRLADTLVVAILEGIAILVDVLADVAGTEGKEQHHHREDQVRKAEQSIDERDRDGGDRQHEDNGQHDDRNQRRPVGESRRQRKTLVDYPVEPAHAAPVKYLRRETLDNQSDEQGDQGHGNGSGELASEAIIQLQPVESRTRVCFSARRNVRMCRYLTYRYCRICPQQ